MRRELADDFAQIGGEGDEAVREAVARVELQDAALDVARTEEGAAAVDLDDAVAAVDGAGIDAEYAQRRGGASGVAARALCGLLIIA